MYLALRGVFRGEGPYAGCRGQSEFGGRDKTIKALITRALIEIPKVHEGYVITNLGLHALDDFETKLAAMREFSPGLPAS